MLNVAKIKQDFPVFKNNPGLVYLDSANTSLKAQSVIDKLVEYYEKYPGNIKRGIYNISEKATEEYEATRAITAKFINAYDTREVIFTSGTTESINLVAYSLGRQIVEEGDEVVVSILEHHSNFVPWQQLSFENGATFKVIDINEDGELLSDMDEIVTLKTKILSLTAVSNVMGTVLPIKQIIKDAKRINSKIIVVIDAAQAVPHMKVDVRELGADFVAFSFHKMVGPTGIGVLWGKTAILEEMFPFKYGGEMIREVTIEKTTFDELPHKFEAGTPAIAEVIAAKEAIHYIQTLGLENIQRHEEELVSYTTKRFQEELGNAVRIFGLKKRTGIVTFSVRNVHPHDVAQILDEDQIAIRAGHHCTMPLHQRLNLTATARASFYMYNSKEDVDKLISGLKKVNRMFK